MPSICLFVLHRKHTARDDCVFYVSKINWHPKKRHKVGHPQKQIPNDEMHLIILIFSLVAFCKGEYNNFARNYTNCQVVSLDPVIELHWNLVGSTIQIGMYGEARYYSVGFSSDGSMTNAGNGADAWVVISTKIINH